MGDGIKPEEEKTEESVPTHPPNPRPRADSIEVLDASP